MRPLKLVRLGGFAQDPMEALYQQVVEALDAGAAEPLAVDLSVIGFLRPNEILALVSIARLWHRRTGHRMTLVAMQSQVHRYLERVDLFTTCGEWVKQDRELSHNERYSRSSASRTLLEVIPIASDPDQNGWDVDDAVVRARRIVKTWFGANKSSVDRLLTILAEVATNITHSHDQGYAVIQRYRHPTDPTAGGRVSVAIADLGIGIEASLRSKPVSATMTPLPKFARGSDAILHAFKLGVTSRDTVAGLGLARVRAIVEEWHGSLHVRSLSSCVHFDGELTIPDDDLPAIPGTHVTFTVRDPG